MAERATTPIREDHVRLLEHVEHTRFAAQEVPELSPDERKLPVARDDTARLQQLLYGLSAPISVHFWKKEALYLPLVDEQGGPEVRAALEAAGTLAHGKGAGRE